MKTLFFIQGNLISVINNTASDLWLATSNFKLSDCIFGILALICVIYTAVALIKAYYLLYKSPKQQSNWLEEKFPESEKEEIK